MFNLKPDSPDISKGGLLPDLIRDWVDKRKGESLVVWIYYVDSTIYSNHDVGLYEPIGCQCVFSVMFAVNKRLAPGNLSIM